MNKSVVVVGLGYVGLPLALGFGRVMPTIGFEISQPKVDAYRNGYDPTGEMPGDLFFAGEAADIYHERCRYCPS